MKRVTILGATGSIGTQTLDVISQNSDDFEVVALTASESVEKMAELIQRFCPSYAVMKNEEKAEELRKLLPNHSCEILYGMDGFVAVSTLPNVDVVVAAMVGMIGLRPVMEAIRAGKDIALANKETLVTAGHIIMPLAKEYGVSILPVDSEHSAIFQCLNGEKKSQIETLFLTASGGPFRHGTKEELEKVTVEQALMHPNWSMGAKITVDSASMINKGLEIMETRWLFDVPRDKIEVVVHPQSIIHSMVEYRDGCVMAQMANPDMTLPIMYALSYPDREQNVCEKLDLFSVGTLTFEKPDLNKFPCLALAYEAAAEDGALQLALNSANEIAVMEFLQRRIPFGGIARVVEASMNKFCGLRLNSFEDIYEADLEVRAFAKELIESGGAISQSFQQIFH